MRILLVAIFGFILAACGQDYEEVHGIKIGAPISKVEGIEGYDFIESCDLTLWSKEPIDELGVRTILAVDGAVVGVVVNENKDSFRERLALIQSTYGKELEKEDSDDEWITFENKTYRVEAHPIMTTYTTKEFNERSNEIIYGCD